MTRSLLVVVDPLAPSELLEFSLEGRCRDLLLELIENTTPKLEWIEIGEGSLVDRILHRGPAPSPVQAARARVNAKYYVKAKATGKAKATAKYPTAKRRRKCPHCGELFAPRGLGPHVFAVHTNRAEFMARAKRVAVLKAERRALAAGSPAST